jgi:2-succinyl-5-enolpyruvyl-6-hydroxy-3-cyclohexene-1-carboxylate synthase
VVVLDDDGGTIFDLLPPGRVPAQRRLFATPHGRDLAKLAELHGIAFERLDGHDSVSTKIRACLSPTGQRLILVPVRPLDADRAAAVRIAIDSVLVRPDGRGSVSGRSRP